MRAAALGVLCLCLIPVACTQAPPLPSDGPPSSAPARVVQIPAKAEEAVTSPAAPEPSRSPGQPLKMARANLSGINFEGVAFDSRNHRLAVVDQPSGPGSRHPDAKAAAAYRNGLAAFNAGFFTPDGSPLGKLVSAGVPAGSWNRSSLGSGVFIEDISGRMALGRRNTALTGQREMLQAGPLLVENGSAVSGLDTAKPAVRTLIAWDGGSRWWIGRSSSCTLAELGVALQQGSPASWPVQMALNLDGGRSTDLWISSAVPGGPANFRPPWNRPVRNFLVLLPR